MAVAEYKISQTKIHIGKQLRSYVVAQSNDEVLPQYLIQGVVHNMYRSHVHSETLHNNFLYGLLILTDHVVNPNEEALILYGVYLDRRSYMEHYTTQARSMG